MAREFKAKSICILGRQPALGLAELERLYGAEHLRLIGGHALLGVPAEEINFKKLGGTIKVARILSELDDTKWSQLVKYLINKIPEHLQYVPARKFTLGLSLYGLNVSVSEINRAGLELKQVIKKSGRPARVVPNKTTALNSAQVLHNKLTHQGAWELIFIKDGRRTLLAQTLFVQDIEAYAARDQARPARDARVGMLPPKLAQIMINLATGQIDSKTNSLARIRILDPFCGSGVILQEALLMGYSVMGTDLDERMIGYSKQNLQWLFKNFPELAGTVVLEQADSTNYQWPGFSALASEVYLGRPLSSLPSDDKLRSIIADTNTVIKKFLQNLLPQVPSPKHTMCLAVPAWRKPNGQLIRLPLLANLTEMGYNYVDLKQVRREELVYFRENQIVARQLIILRKQ